MEAFCAAAAGCVDASCGREKNYEASDLPASWVCSIAVELELQSGGHGLHHRSIGIVVLQRPDIRSAQSTGHFVVDVDHLEQRRDRTVVRVEGLRLRVVQRDGNSLRIEMRCISVVRQVGERCVRGKAGRQQSIASGSVSAEVRTRTGPIGQQHRGGAGRVLIQPMIDVGNSSPACAIGRNAHGVLPRRHSGLQVRIDGIVDVQVLAIVRVLMIVEQRRCMVSLRVPRSGIVVAIDGDEIHLRAAAGRSMFT
jgi:hypothetical protein